jgi:hypothetical protein
VIIPKLSLVLSSCRNGDSRSAKLCENAIIQIPSAARVILFIRPLNKRKPFQPSTVGGKKLQQRGRRAEFFPSFFNAINCILFKSLPLRKNDFCSDGIKNTTFIVKANSHE